MRLDKRLANAGLATRSGARALVKSKSVFVDGKLASDPGMQVSDDSDVRVNGKPVSAGFRYIMLHKPAGVVTAVIDAQPTVMELLPKDVSHGLFPIGRLDKETEGLLLLTDDGAYAHRLISPKSDITKKYCTVISAPTPPDEDMILRFAQGIKLLDFTAKPAQLSIIGKWRDTEFWETVVQVTEGKYHQVRRMFGACGAHVEYLRREQIGALELDETLEPGQWRYITSSEKEAAEYGNE